MMIIKYKFNAYKINTLILFGIHLNKKTRFGMDNNLYYCNREVYLKY